MKLVVIGAGGHSKVVVDTARMAGWDVVGFCDDRIDSALFELPFMGFPNTLILPEDTHAVIAIGDNAIRQKIADELEGRVSWANVVHPQASVSSLASLQVGTVVFAGAVIQADCAIGKHNIINTNASIDHDCFTNDFCHIAPGAVLAGGVRLDTGVFVGAGATVIPNQRIGQWTILGAGAVALHDLESNSVFAGVPAYRLRS
jgi:sugar O-acyltransferase (sialic acid O-acetyltransferase NeuD family)